MPETERLAIYPGTFDPITRGHVDVLERALHIFDAIEIAIGVNVAKTSLLSVEQRMELVRESTSHLSGISVAAFDGLIAEYAGRRGAVALVRGIRDCMDLEFERRMFFANRRLNPKLETVYFAPAEQHALVSASLVREIHRHGGDVGSFVPPAVVRVLSELKDARQADGGSG